MINTTLDNTLASNYKTPKQEMQRTNIIKQSLKIKPIPILDT